MSSPYAYAAFDESGMDDQLQQDEWEQGQMERYYLEGRVLEDGRRVFPESCYAGEFLLNEEERAAEFCVKIGLLRNIKPVEFFQHEPTVYYLSKSLMRSKIMAELSNPNNGICPVLSDYTSEQRTTICMMVNRIADVMLHNESLRVEFLRYAQDVRDSQDVPF